MKKKPTILDEWIENGDLFYVPFSPGVQIEYLRSGSIWRTAARVKGKWVYGKGRTAHLAGNDIKKRLPSQTKET